MCADDVRMKGIGGIVTWDQVNPDVPAKPTTITIEFDTVDPVSNFMGRHGVEIIEPLKVVSRARTG